MSGGAQRLPAGYAMLEPFVDDWAVPTMAARARRRDDSSAEEQRAFYEAARHVAVPALAELDAKPVAAYDERDRRLMLLLLSYSHVALTIEIRGAGEAEHRAGRKHQIITHEPGGIFADCE